MVTTIIDKYVVQLHDLLSTHYGLSSGDIAKLSGLVRTAQNLAYDDVRITAAALYLVHVTNYTNLPEDQLADIMHSRLHSPEFRQTIYSSMQYGNSVNLTPDYGDRFDTNLPVDEIRMNLIICNIITVYKRLEFAFKNNRIQEVPK